MQLRKLAVLPAVGALLLAAACGGGGDDGDSDGAPQTQGFEGGTAGEGQNPDAEGPAPEVDGATEGGTATVLTQYAPSTMDPTRAYYVDSTAFLNLVTRGLTGFQRQEDGNYVLVPDMATDLGQVSEDGLTWTWTLKDGIKYQDGTDVVAEDVAYAIKRAFAQDVLTSGPTYHNEFFVDGDSYNGPYKDGDDYAGVTVVDDKTFEIHLTKPFTDLAYYASFPMFTGIPEAKDTKLDYEREIMATGPYMIEEYIPQRSLTLVRNPEWDPDSDPIRHAYPDEWQFEFSQDSNQLQERIIGDSGEDQTALTYDSILASKYRQLLNTDGGEERLTTGTSPCTYWVALDTRKITDVNVRKAIGVAYPQEDANRELGLIQGLTALPATTILPPGLPGREEYDLLGTGGEGNGDPEAANQMLKDAGEEGFKLSFFFQTDIPESVNSSEVVEQGLEKAGFDVERIPTTSEQIREDIEDPNAPVNMRGTGWCSDFPSGASWFPPVFDGSIPTPQSTGTNYAMIDEPEINKENDRILALEDPAEAAKAWAALDKMMQEKYYPVVLRYYDGVAWPHGSKIGNMQDDNTKGMPDFPNIYVME